MINILMIMTLNFNMFPWRSFVPFKVHHRQLLLHLGSLVHCCRVCTCNVYGLARGPLLLKTRVVRLGDPEAHNHLRARAGDRAEGSLVHMYRDCSIAPILFQRRRLKSVFVLFQGSRASGFSISRRLLLFRQWERVIIGGPVGLLSVLPLKIWDWIFLLGYPPSGHA